MWEGEWRDIYAKKTTAAFTRSFTHFSLSLIVSTWVQALMQLLSHTPGPSYHTPHVIHGPQAPSLAVSLAFTPSMCQHESTIAYDFDVPYQYAWSRLQWRVLVLGPCYNKYEYEVLPHFRYSPICTHFKVLFMIHTANKDEKKKTFLWAVLMH